MKYLFIFFLISCTQLTKNGNVRIPQSVEEKSFSLDNHLGSDLGSIKASILPETAFQKLMGDGWVLMDGRCIAWKCCKEEQNNNLKPKCEEALKGQNSDLYSLIDLHLGSSEKATLSEEIILSNRITDLRGKFLRMNNNGASGEKFDQKNDRKIGSYQKDALKSHSHEYDAHNNLGANGVKSNAQLESKRKSTSVFGDKETRPKNISVNYYIKIND